MALVVAAADKETAKALDRAAGPQWRWIARVGTLVSLLAGAVVRGRIHAIKRIGSGVPASLCR